MENDQEIDERVPCPDGACTGLIGDDGRCGTCGRAGPVRDAPRAESAPRHVAPDVPDVPAVPDVPDERALAPTTAAPDDDTTDERVPCDDGMCTGILGVDGRCGTCGLPGRGAPRDADG